MDSVRCQGQEATQRILDSIVLFTPEYNRTFIVVSFLTYHPSSRSQWVPQRYELSFELDERPGVRWEFRCDDIAGQCLPCDPTRDIWIPEWWLAWSHRWPNYYQDTSGKRRPSLCKVLDSFTMSYFTRRPSCYKYPYRSATYRGKVWSIPTSLPGGCGA